MNSTASVIEAASGGRFGFDQSPARSRGTAFALTSAGVYLGLMLSWGVLRGWKISLAPTEFLGLLALAGFAQRTQVIVRPRLAYTPATLVVVFGGLVGGPLVGLGMGGAAALAMEAQWRPRLVWGCGRGLEGMVAGLIALALQPTASATLPTALLALVAAGAISSSFVAVTAWVRRIPSPRSTLAMSLQQSVIEVIIGSFLVAALASGFSRDPWQSLAALASLVAAIALADRIRRGYLKSLEMERLLARHDPATGAPNRRAFLEALSGEHSRIQRDGERSAGLLFIDFDRFKRVNDSYGHAVGDEALSSVVTRLAENLRIHDIAARWGGEEFVLLAPGCDAHELAELAERTRTLFADQPLALSAGDVPVTVSVGATLLMADSSPEDALERTTKALKRAKQTRDTVCLDLPAC